MESVTLFVAGRNRRFRVVRPAPPCQGSGWPIVLALPGTGATADWADDETGWSTQAVGSRTLLAIPEGSPPDPLKPPKFLTNPPRWNDGSTQSGDPIHSDADDVAFLDAIVDYLIIAEQGDPQRVFLTGFSNGAGMIFRYASERAERITAIAPVAGHCWIDPGRLSRVVPTLYLVGTVDPLLPLAGGPARLPWGGRVVQRPTIDATLTRWAIGLGLPGEPTQIIDGTDQEKIYGDDASFRAIFLGGHGHHWPGGLGRLHPRYGGPCRDYPANQVIWSFFLGQ